MGEHDDGKGPQEEDVKIPKPNFARKHPPGAHAAPDEGGKSTWRTSPRSPSGSAS